MGNTELTSFPALALCWQEYLGEIDEQLVDFYSTRTEQSEQALSEITQRIGFWLDNHDLGSQASTELDAAQESGLFEDLLQGRIAQLLQDGKLQFARSTDQAVSV